MVCLTTEMFFDPEMYEGSVATNTSGNEAPKSPTKFAHRFFRPIRTLIKKASASTTASSRKNRSGSSVVYMGANVHQSRNTGYAFSHEENYGREVANK